MDRRSVLKMVAATPFIAGGVKLAETLTPQQRVDILSAELVAAMNEMDATRTYWWRHSPENGLAIIIGDQVA